MIRNALFVMTFALFSSALAGCHLYLGEAEGDDETQFCDSSGCYTCDDWGCYPNDAEPGWDCSTNYDCAAGCFCNDDGLCEEAGFCTPGGNDCPEGFTCDDRSSCVPEGSDSCTSDSECPLGAYCDEDSGVCIGSSTCDAESLECADDLECDLERSTCAPPDLPAQTCQSEVTCDEEAPTCASGFTAVIENGCYTGGCMAKADCPDGAPFECSDLDNDEGACIANPACSAIYTGVNCTSPNGETCTSGTANCTCESFNYNSCEAI